jgi:hypothetical protein
VRKIRNDSVGSVPYPLDLQLPILPISQVDVGAASAPRSNAVLEGIHAFRIAAHHEGTKAIQGSEAIVTSLCADEGSAIGFYKVNPPEAGVAVEVHQDAGHGGIVEGHRQPGTCSTCGFKFEPKGLRSATSFKV